MEKKKKTLTKTKKKKKKYHNLQMTSFIRVSVAYHFKHVDTNNGGGKLKRLH